CPGRGRGRREPWRRTCARGARRPWCPGARWSCPWWGCPPQRASSRSPWLSTTLRPALLPGVEPEGARRCELAELVTDHRLGDVHRDVLAPVVHGDGVADHLGDDRAAARP